MAKRSSLPTLKAQRPVKGFGSPNKTDDVGLIDSGSSGGDE